MIKVLLADDHVIFRRGLCQIIADTDTIEVVGEASSGTETVQLARTVPADVLVLDISLVDRNGLDVLKQLKRELPRLAVLMLSMHAEDQYATRVIRAGASGFLSKEDPVELIVPAVRKVLGGGIYISPGVAERLALEIGHPNEGCRTPACPTASSRFSTGWSRASA